MAPQYGPGAKLIHSVENVELELGNGCALLEKFYMQNFKKALEKQKSGIMVSFKPEILYHDKSSVFPVN